MHKHKIVLVVAAHGDDEVLGLGATIAQHCANGNLVHVIIMGDGVSSRFFDPNKGILAKDKKTVEFQIKRRVNETLKAAQILGVPKKQVNFLGLRDQGLDTYPFLSLIKHIEKVKIRINPDIIYTHFFGDLNLDHRLTCEAVMTAFRPAYGKVSPQIFLFEVPESTSLAMRRGVTFKPNHSKVVGKYMGIKLKALQAYESEQRAYPHPRSSLFIKKIKKERFLKV